METETNEPETNKTKEEPEEETDPSKPMSKAMILIYSIIAGILLFSLIKLVLEFIG